MKNAEWAKRKAKSIQTGKGLAPLTVPLGSLAVKLQNEDEFKYGVEYGYLQALKDVFGILEDNQ